MKKQDLLNILFTFVVGLVVGVYMFFAGFAPTTAIIEDTVGEIGQTLLESPFVKFSSTHQWPTNVCQETRSVVTYECHPVSHQLDNFKHAHPGSRTRVTSMGGLYDAATLRAP